MRCAKWEGRRWELPIIILWPFKNCILGHGQESDAIVKQNGKTKNPLSLILRNSNRSSSKNFQNNFFPACKIGESTRLAKSSSVHKARTPPLQKCQILHNNQTNQKNGMTTGMQNFHFTYDWCWRRGPRWSWNFWPPPHLPRLRGLDPPSFVHWPCSPVANPLDWNVRGNGYACG